MTTHIFEMDTLDGWELWTAPNPPEPDKGPPELNIEVSPPGHADSVHNPPSSLRFRKHWATWHAGVMRQFTVTRDSVLKLSAWGRIWDTVTGVFPDPSDTSVHAYFRVGIDETGGTSPTSSGVKWNELRAGDAWQKLSIQAVAQAQVITIFVGFENGRGCMWNLDKMYAFLDTVELIVEGETTPPEPPPTQERARTVYTESVEDKGTWFRVIQWWPKGKPGV